jgi:hypothetical protein
MLALLINALVAVGALLKRDGVFHCTEESKALAPARSGLLHMVHLWDTWSTLTVWSRRSLSDSASAMKPGLEPPIC